MGLLLVGTTFGRATFCQDYFCWGYFWWGYFWWGYFCGATLGVIPGSTAVLKRLALGSSKLVTLMLS